MNLRLGWTDLLQIAATSPRQLILIACGKDVAIVIVCHSESSSHPTLGQVSLEALATCLAVSCVAELSERKEKDALYRQPGSRGTPWLQKTDLPPYGISRHSDLSTKCASMIIGLALDTLVIKMSKLQ